MTTKTTTTIPSLSRLKLAIQSADSATGNPGRTRRKSGARCRNRTDLFSRRTLQFRRMLHMVQRKRAHRLQPRTAHQSHVKIPGSTGHTPMVGSRLWNLHSSERRSFHPRTRTEARRCTCRQMARTRDASRYSRTSRIQGYWWNSTNKART